MFGSMMKFQLFHCTTLREIIFSASFIKYSGHNKTFFFPQGLTVLFNIFVIKKTAIYSQESYVAVLALQFFKSK